MIDRDLTLAIALATDPGSYAFLVGSGMSRSAGIPTGFEIVTDLILKVAALTGDDPGQDPQVPATGGFSRTRNS
jgi:hypothetical protein